MPDFHDVDKVPLHKRRPRFSRARFRRVRIRRPPKVFFPNAVTALSIFTGYLSIIYTLDGQYSVGAWLILLAGFLDAMDGRIARRMDATSDFGAEFDSMADVINYGVSPSLLFYKIFFAGFGIPGMVLCFLCVFCAAFRLARFNVLSRDGMEQNSFTGLPSTVAAGWLASYVIFAHTIWPTYGSPLFATGMIIAASSLMVSQVRYEKSKVDVRRALFRTRRILLLSMIALTVIFAPTMALFLWATIFVVMGVIRSLALTVKTSLKRA